MKMLFNLAQKFISRIGLAPALLLLAASPLLTSAQSQTYYFSGDDVLTDSLNQRMQRRMADVSLRMDSLSDYLADLHPGDDAFFWMTPDFPPMPDMDFFNPADFDFPEFPEPADCFRAMPPMPEFEFDFSPDFFGDETGADSLFHFFRQGPGDGGVWIYLDNRDSVGGTAGGNFKKVVILRQNNDTVVLEGDHNMVYTIADSNGVYSVKNYKLAGDTIITDPKGTYSYTYSDHSRKPGKNFNWSVGRKGGSYRVPRQFSGNYFVTPPAGGQSSNITDLTPREIENLKNTDLKPSRKAALLGINKLKADLIRDSRQLRLRFNLDGEGDLNVQLFDSDGTLFHDESLRKSSGRYDNRIALPDSHAEAYYVRITRGKQSLIKKIAL